jgi:hypothetical protein
MKLSAMLFAMGACLSIGACASTGGSSGDGTPVVVRGDEDVRIDTGGIPPDKQAEIYLVLQQRDASVRKCYQDVLNEKKTREFKGRVTVLLSLTPAGTAKNVRVMGGTLKNKEVEDCLVATIKEFEFPQLDRGGDLQYDYSFEPQY